MNITKTITLNTGGNCMVDYHLIENGGELKAIGVTDECLVGFSSNEPWLGEVEHEIWVIDKATPPNDLIPFDILITLKERCTFDWPLEEESDMSAKREHPLQVGDEVHLETVFRFNPTPRKSRSFHVVEVNKNSAYCVRYDFLERYNKTKERRLRTRIDQRTKKVMDNEQGFDMTHLLWFDETEFNSDFNGQYRNASDRT